MEDKAVESLVTNLPRGDIARGVFGLLSADSAVALDQSATTDGGLFDTLGVDAATQQQLYDTARKNFRHGGAAASSASEDDFDRRSNDFDTDPQFGQGKPAKSFEVPIDVRVQRGGDELRSKRAHNGLAIRTGGALQLDGSGTYGRSGAGVATPWTAEQLAVSAAAQRQSAPFRAAAPAPTPRAWSTAEKSQASTNFKTYVGYARTWCEQQGDGDDRTFLRQLNRAGLTLLSPPADHGLISLLLETCTASGPASLTELGFVATACGVPTPDGFDVDDSQDVLGLG